MKFSYKLIKKLTPYIKNKKELSEKLSSRAFEIDSITGDTIDIKIPANRYDASGHIGLAKEISALYGRKFNFKNSKIGNKKSLKVNFGVVVKDKKSCSRYSAQYFEIERAKKTPKWMKDILIDCGMRPINPVVDIMNYVMVETGQPMHAFDYDKLATGKNGRPEIFIRKAKPGEVITTLDDNKFTLSADILVIADDKRALAIAGIKGGKAAEVDVMTKNIIIESANFDAVNIYGASRKLKLVTDASARFSRNISPELTIMGVNRASELLKEIVGAKEGVVVDIYGTKKRSEILKFDIDKFNKFIGVDFDFKIIKKYLELLDFNIKVHANQIKNIREFIVEAPAVRMDIENPEDLYEEVVRLYGYNELKPVAPHIHLMPSGFEDLITLKDKIRKVLMGFGLSEVYNHSFVSGNFSFKNDAHKLVELENPISKEFEYLRPTLAPNLIGDVEYNSRFFDEMSFFEIGNVFIKTKDSNDIKEKKSLGIVLASKKDERFFELKGLVGEMFKKIGLVDYTLAEVVENDWVRGLVEGYLNPREILKIESGGKIFGYLGKVKSMSELTGGELAGWNISLMELDAGTLLHLISGEHEYLPLPKYPSVMRDISVLVDRSVKVGDIMQSIQLADIKHIEDVDLTDEYEFKEEQHAANVGLRGKKSLTFRIVFQAQDKTLTDGEVNQEMGKVEGLLRNEFRADIR